MSYIDTSIIVAALDPQDPRFKKARALLEEEGDKVISEVVLAELASIVARREGITSSIASRLGLSREEALIAILLYILKRFNLRYKSIENTTRLPLIGKVYRPIATAVELAPRAKLRTLDLLHVAYVKLMKNGGEPIRKLVTADSDFKKARRLLKEEVCIDLHIITC